MKRGDTLGITGCGTCPVAGGVTKAASLQFPRVAAGATRTVRPHPHPSSSP